MRTDRAGAVGPPGSQRLSVSVVIATGDDGADRLAACLAALASAPRRGIDLEVLVVDAGASPAIAAVVEAAGGRLLQLAGPRGARFGAGARAATGEWLVLLRSVTVLESGWDATLMVYAHDSRNRDRAAVYAYRAEGDAVAAQRAERTIRFRNRWLGLPSGAQGLAIRRRFLVHVGGVPELDRGEDLVLARRLGTKRLAAFDVAAWSPPVGTGIGDWLRLLLFVLRAPPGWIQGMGD